MTRLAFETVSELTNALPPQTLHRTQLVQHQISTVLFIRLERIVFEADAIIGAISFDSQ
jgi:hypothetical protein